MTDTTNDRREGVPSGAHPLHEIRLALARLTIEGTASLPRAFSCATDICATALGVQRVGIWLFDAAGESVQCVHLHNRGTNEHGPGEILHLTDYPGYLDAIRHLRTIAAEDVSDDRRTEQLMAAYFARNNIVSTLDAAIYRMGALVGIVCNEHVGAPRRWTNEERDFAATVADMISLLWEEAARVEAEKQLAQREAIRVESLRMEALGRLAASVAHDANNLLQVVSSFASRIRVTTSIEDASDFARQIIESTSKAAALNRQILSFGRPPTVVDPVIDLGHVVERMHPVLEAALQRRVSLVLELSSTTPRVRMAATEVEQILLNLVLNARDASPSGGTVRIRVGQENSQAELCVTDTGAGMTNETQARIFEPFFTTKAEGEGTGLGLAIVQGIVLRAGGTIVVESAPGGGATFRISLPIASAIPPSDPPVNQDAQA